MYVRSNALAAKPSTRHTASSTYFLQKQRRILMESQAKTGRLQDKNCNGSMASCDLEECTRSVQKYIICKDNQDTVFWSLKDLLPSPAPTDVALSCFGQACAAPEFAITDATDEDCYYNDRKQGIAKKFEKQAPLTLCEVAGKVYHAFPLCIERPIFADGLELIPYAQKPNHSLDEYYYCEEPGDARFFRVAPSPIASMVSHTGTAPVPSASLTPNPPTPWNNSKVFLIGVSSGATLGGILLIVVLSYLAYRAICCGKRAVDNRANRASLDWTRQIN